MTMSLFCLFSYVIIYFVNFVMYQIRLFIQHFPEQYFFLVLPPFLISGRLLLGIIHNFQDTINNDLCKFF